MNAPSEHPPNDAAPPLQANLPGEASSQAPPPGQRTRNLWRGLDCWFQANAFAPRWLPTWARHPLLGYLVAALIQLAATGMMLAIVHLFPEFAFIGALGFLGVVGMALSWGAGPSLCATLVGAILLDYVVLPPQFSFWPSESADALGLALFLAIGFSISLLASRSERARRRAEEMNRLLTQAEARSAADYQRLRTVLEVLPAAVVIANAEGQVLAVNQATTRLWGEEVPLATEINQYHLYPGRWARTGKPLAPQDWTLARALTRGEVVQNDEIELETPDGQRKIILTSAAPMRDEAGAITGGVATAQDITEVRRLEREVAERAQELEAIFESMADGVLVYDADGRIVRLNAPARAFFGPEADIQLALPLEARATAQPAYDASGRVLAAAQLPAVRLLHGEMLTGAQTVDLSTQRPEGRTLLLNLSGMPIRAAAGAITGAVLVARDMTEPRRLEHRTHEALNALLAMAEALVQVQPPAVPLRRAGDTLPLMARRLADLTRRVLACRRVSMAAVEATTRLLHPITVVGLSPELERAWWDSWSPPRRTEERFDPELAAVEADEPRRLDRASLPEHAWSTLYEARSGLLVPMHMGEELVGILLVDYGEEDHSPPSQEELAVIRAISRLGALVLDRDRLLRRWAEARANELAISETKARMDTFLGIASHELKSPLTSIKLGLQLSQRRLQQLVRSKAGEGEEDGAALAPVQESLTRTERQAERLERLVNDLLDVSRIQAGKLDLRLEWADLATIVREGVEEQRQAEPDRTIWLQFSADLHVPVYADAWRIEQVVTNYLTNALKYSPADRPIEVGMQIEPQQARVWVRDEGPGLPAEEQECIWERFHRAKGIEVQSGTGIGLGLGLHICRTIIEQHHGRVGVESAPGKGSTFWFIVPLARSEAAGQLSR